MIDISVIIPVYNEEKVIGRCLELLVRQTLKPKEIIVVDDGSMDGTLKAIEIAASQTPRNDIKILRQDH